MDLKTKLSELIRLIKQKKIIPLKLLCCHCCGKLFCLCSSCYRGHKYCCKNCRVSSQRKAHREAQRLYRQKEKGKKAHRESEKRRRLGKAAKKEIVKIREKLVECCESAVERTLSIIESAVELGKKACCHFCDRPGVTSDSFYRGYIKVRTYSGAGGLIEKYSKESLFLIK